MKLTIKISMLMIVFVLAPVYAQGPRSPSERFSIHDLNHDGRIDRYEYRDMFSRWEQRHVHAGKPSFSSIDENADGYITEDELIKVLNQQLRQQRRYRAREKRWSQEGY